MTSVFADYQARAWPHRFAVTLHVGVIAGGWPVNPKVAESWLKTKLADKDVLIRQAVASMMAEREMTVEEATREVDDMMHLNAFRRDPVLGLYLEGRSAKAMLKEAASVAVASGKLSGRGWGTTNKGLRSYLAEHVFVLDQKIPLGVTEPTGVMQRFTHTWRGDSIQNEEYVEDAELPFTVVSDHDFTHDEWAMIWSTAEKQGIGASRSQGFGTFEVTQWDRLSGTPGNGRAPRAAKPRQARAAPVLAGTGGD